jgi:hypothetical protein
MECNFLSIDAQEFLQAEESFQMSFRVFWEN